jgi:hypothetical protein
MDVKQRSFVRPFDSGTGVEERPALMIWRLTGMLVLLVLLVIALIPTTSNDWGVITWKGVVHGNSGWGIPAVCFWGTT